MSEEVEEKPVLTSLWLAVLWVPRDLHEIALIYRGPHLSGSVSHSSMCSLSQNKLSEQSITLCSHPQKHVDHCQLRLCYAYYIGPVSLKLFYSIHEMKMYMNMASELVIFQHIVFLFFLSLYGQPF